MQHFDWFSNDRKLEEKLELLEKVRLEAKIKTAANKRIAEQCFNKRVRPRTFTVGDIVLKEIGMPTQDEGKIGPQ